MIPTKSAQKPIRSLLLLSDAWHPFNNIIQPDNSEISFFLLVKKIYNQNYKNIKLIIAS